MAHLRTLLRLVPLSQNPIHVDDQRVAYPSGGRMRRRTRKDFEGPSRIGPWISGSSAPTCSGHEDWWAPFSKLSRAPSLFLFAPTFSQRSDEEVLISDGSKVSAFGRVLGRGMDNCNDAVGVCADECHAFRGDDLSLRILES